MHDKDKIVLVYTGNEVTVERIKVNLEMEGIIPIVKDGFNSGLSAGFVGGVPSGIDLFVLDSDFEKAIEIVKVIVEE
ncbi:MAG: DUF2007 domain-containing protein [Bacteroidetes bacterium]|nr:DUF2007 domain-containing protein [Bacteroidota bacterium]